MRNELEVLAPAGSIEILKAVINAGADAVYLGGSKFGARAYANNFTEEELLEAIDYAHLRGVKVYLTVNTLLKNDEIKDLIDYLYPYYLRGLDAVLIQDFGALKLVHEALPELPIHTSTQMTVTGSMAVKLLGKYGVTRVVMAREVSLDEMKTIHDETGMEIEAFVHGALCYCYSGQCLFSSILGGRSGNRGRCAQPCRLSYAVLDENKKTILKDSYILSLKDFCTIDSLDKIKEAGVFSLKIEGRMKKSGYAAGVVSMYRKYADLVNSGKFSGISKKDKSKLLAYGSRSSVTDNYLTKHNGSDMVTYEKPSFLSTDSYESAFEKKNQITGYMLARKDEAMTLSLICGDYSVTAEGPLPLEAKNAPASVEDVKIRISKINDTAFAFENLEVYLDDGLFIPNKALNELKRQAISLLEEEILKEYRRKEVDFEKNHCLDCTKKENAFDLADDKPKYIASIENLKLLNTLLAEDIFTDIYLDTASYNKKTFRDDLSKDVGAIRAKKKAVYLMLPIIFRKHTFEFYKGQTDFLKSLKVDGFVVRNYEELYFVKEYFKEAKIITDGNLYTYNDYAVSAFKEEGAKRLTVPLELNRKELAGRDNRDSEIIIYGYYPMMVTANCINKNALTCDKKTKVLGLKDRYNVTFPVKNLCSECMNIIYNSLPTSLIDNMSDLGKYGINNYRVHFTIETKDEAKVIVESVKKGKTDNSCAVTKGHYKRGVE